MDSKYLIKRPANRRIAGSMLLMVALVTCVLFVIIGFGLAIYLMVFQQKRSQNEADALALTLAQHLNFGDREGQMNNMIARCRELVYVSRQNHQTASEGYKHLEPLARQLLEESRQSAFLMESERKRLKSAMQEEVRREVHRLEAQSSVPTIALPGMTGNAPKVVGVELGSIKDVLSNVESSAGEPDLIEADLKRGFIQKDSKLYFGNINVRLPPPDNDLDFKICSLPPPVKGSVSPPRLTDGKVFKKMSTLLGASKPSGSDHLPSAVHLRLMMKITTGAGDKNHKQDTHNVEVAATAAAAGGSQMP